MKIIKHKFRDYKNKNNIEILILGTFNPDAENNEADFFYGRKRNHLWNLLPQVFNHPSLKDQPIENKKEFIEMHKIGFADLIDEIEIENGQENNYSDGYIDGMVTKWTDIEHLINNCPSIKSIFFSRKTFSDIPNMAKQIEKIKLLCITRNILFHCLPTPARFNNENKINEWKEIFKQ